MNRLSANRCGTRLVAAAVAAAAIALAACSTGDMNGDTSAVAAGDSAAACVGNNGGLTLPDGICATIFADSIGAARHISVAANGDVFVAIESKPSIEGQGAKKGGEPSAVVALRDTNGDGRADSVVHIGERGNTGVQLWHDGLFVDKHTEIVRYPMTAGQLEPTGEAVVVVSGIPIGGNHNSRNFVIDSSGALYVNIGTATNSCQVKDRTTGSPGHDPCDELNTRGGIWKFDANKTAQKFTSSARFATGIRNAEGLAIGPDGKLWATQHGRDQLSDNWPELFTSEYSAENPAEELMQVNEGDDFGWPYCYFSVEEKKLVLAPEYGGDGTKTGRCDDKKAPVAWFPGHWAPMSLLFYSGDKLPDRYNDGAFIAFHGSWNRAPQPQAGYRVVFQPLNGTTSAGDFETFANGFAGGQLSPDRAAHRPVGLAQGPDGALYISDDAAGRVWRVTSGGR